MKQSFIKRGLYYTHKIKEDKEMLKTKSILLQRNLYKQGRIQGWGSRVAPPLGWGSGVAPPLGWVVGLLPPSN